MAGLPKTFGGMKAVVDAHWDDLTPTLVTGSHNAVLLLGRAALYRVTGRSGVLAEQGSTYLCEIGGSGKIPVVCSTHPASVMRSKLEAGWSLIDVAVQRACEYAGGLAFDERAQVPKHLSIYSGAELHRELRYVESGAVIAIDTEFSIVTNKPFLVGLSFDGEHVLSVNVNSDTIPVLQEFFARTDTIKLFHHAPADITALLAVGIDVTPPIEDTLRFNSILYPDLPVGLAKVSLFRLAHWHNWKGMPHDDPQYNAIDVVATRRVRDIQYVEMAQGDMWPVWGREGQHMGLLCMAMEARGLAVDTVARDATIEAWQGDVDTQTNRLKEIADELFEARTEPLEHRVFVIEKELEKFAVFSTHGWECLAHPNYTGLRKPSKKVLDGCCCATIYESRSKDRTTITALRKERTGLATKIKRWSKGFDPGNNDHARWILYDKGGFGFPVQRKDGHVTANADAMARLRTLKKVQQSPLGIEFLDVRQSRQHLAKMISTFLNPLLDAQGCAHPEYRDYGTGTGRLAGGADDDLSDKKVNKYAYNAMNIPNKTRHIYVPHSEDFIVTSTPKDKELADSGDDIEDSTSEEGED
jgi:hypothetical protein